MRQAYDYWQDQPGNYFPSSYTFTHNEHPCINPILATNHHWSLSWLRSSSLYSRSNSNHNLREAFSWSQLAIQPTKQPKAACQTTLVPRSHKFPVHSTLSPLQRNKTSWPSEGTTKYQQHTTICTCWSWWIPNSLICFKLGHQQVVHNPSSMQAFYYLTFNIE